MSDIQDSNAGREASRAEAPVSFAGYLRNGFDLPSGEERRHPAIGWWQPMAPKGPQVPAVWRAWMTTFYPPVRRADESSIKRTAGAWADLSSSRSGADAVAVDAGLSGSTARRLKATRDAVREALPGVDPADLTWREARRLATVMNAVKQVKKPKAKSAR